MANETTTTTAAELMFAEWVSAFIVPNLYAFTAAIPHSREEDLTGKPTTTIKWPQAPALSAAAVNEADAIANTAIDPTSVSATLGLVGIAAEITDLLAESDVLAGVDWYAKQLQQAVEVKVNTDTTALYASFSSSVGATGVDLSETNFLDAISTLEQASAPGPYVFVGHGVQIGDLRKAVAGLATGSNSKVDQGTRHDSEFSPKGAGFAFTLYGVDCYQDGTVATANAGADRAGAMYSDRFALGYAHKWENRVELQRIANELGTVIVVSSAKAEAELKDGAGVKVVTDA